MECFFAMVVSILGSVLAGNRGSGTYNIFKNHSASSDMLLNSMLMATSVHCEQQS